ncbi:MAG: right-handed parallel beta-helix repeat-containing protein [Candidatus Bathyarchaeota archaeon]|nr:right-handed parallel beta-helix repeat-containing protein [Candidatus Bathyarchaeota archaeon]
MPEDYPTIQSAVGNASSGDTVFVRAGTYFVTADSYLTIDKPLSLIGEDAEKTVIDGIDKSPRYWGRYANFWAVISICSSNVTVSGFTIKRGNIALSLEQSTLHAPVHGISVIGNIIENNSYPICGYGSGSDVTISKNNITNNDAGVNFSGWTNSLISENNIIGNKNGIVIDEASNVTVRQNNIIGNGNAPINANIGELSYSGGLFLRWYGPYYVYENTITDNFYFGLEFEGSNNSTISDNYIMRNGAGILLFNYGYDPNYSSITHIASGNRLYHNNIVDNLQNVRIENAPFYNVSRYIGNGTDIISWDNGAVGNYWSDYDGNGTYVIDQNNVDHYPLTQQTSFDSRPPASPVDFVFLIPVAVAAIVLVVLLSLVIIKRKQISYFFGS